MARKIFEIDDELREELRISPDRENRYEKVMSRGEILSNGTEPWNSKQGEKDDK